MKRCRTGTLATLMWRNTCDNSNKIGNAGSRASRARPPSDQKVSGGRPERRARRAVHPQRPPDDRRLVLRPYADCRSRSVGSAHMRRGLPDGTNGSRGGCCTAVASPSRLASSPRCAPQAGSARHRNACSGLLAARGQTEDLRDGGSARGRQDLRRRRRRHVQVCDARGRAVTRHDTKHVDVAHARLCARAFERGIAARGHGSHSLMMSIGRGGRKPMVMCPP